VNFGIPRGTAGDEQELRAQQSERVLDAIIEGANRAIVATLRPDMR
jgi:hypothetical protein